MRIRRIYVLDGSEHDHERFEQDLGTRTDTMNLIYSTDFDLDKHFDLSHQAHEREQRNLKLLKD